MKSNKSKVTAGFCKKCNSQVYLSGGQYSCGCGVVNANSYDFPSSWAFHPDQGAELPKSKSAAKAGSSSPSQ